MKKLEYCPPKNSDTIKFSSQKDLAQIIKQKDFVLAIPKESNIVYFLSLEDDEVYFTYVGSTGNVTKDPVNIDYLITYYNLYTFTDIELANKLLKN